MTNVLIYLLHSQVIKVIVEVYWNYQTRMCILWENIMGIELLEHLKRRLNVHFYIKL